MGVVPIGTVHKTMNRHENKDRRVNGSESHPPVDSKPQYTTCLDGSFCRKPFYGRAPIKISFVWGATIFKE